MKHSGSPGPSIRVLVIDPPTEDVSTLASQLGPEAEVDLSIDAVSGIDAARDRLGGEYVDCVVCRHDPPTIDGVEVLTELRAEDADLPVLLATDAAATDGAVLESVTDVVTVTDGRINGAVVANRIRSIVSQRRDRGKYEQIFEQANDGIVVHDADGDILEANDRFYRMLGYDPDVAGSLTYEDVLVDSGEYTEARARDLIRTAAETDGHTVEWLVRTADGDERWVEVSHESVAIGGVERVLAFVRDISERKENERLLRDREQQLEAIFNHPASFAVVLDDRGRVLRANRPALDHIGATAEDVDGVPLWETPWWPDEGVERDRVRAATSRAADGETTQLEATLATESGTRSLDLRFDPIDDGDGNADGADAEGVTAGGTSADRAHRSVVVGYDITERKERERELRGSRETLRRLNEITADPDLSFDEQVDRLLELGRDRLGLDVAYLSRIDEEADHFEIVHAQADHEMVELGAETALANTYCRRTVASESPYGITNAATEIPDDPVYREVGFECYLGAEIVVDGELYGTLCFADETPRTEPFTDEERTLIEIMAQWLRRGLEERKYRSELERSRTRIEQTMERVDDAFFALDDDWRVTYVNEAGADVLRGAMQADYDDADLIGRHLWEEVPDAVGTTFYEEYNRALAEQESVSFEEYYEPLDVWFEVRAYPDADGISVYFSDITERKANEQELERLHDLLEQTARTADVGGWVVDTEEMELFWTDHLFEILGIDADEEPSLDEALDVYHEEDRPIVEDAIEEAMATAASFDVELRFRRDGERRWLRVQGVPIVEGDEVVRIRGAAQDVTERKEREEVLGRLLRTSQQLIRAGTVDDLLDAIVGGTDVVFDYGLSSVRLHDPEAGTLPAARISPEANEYVDDLPTYDDDEGLPGEAFQSGEARLVTDASEHPELDYEVLESAMFVPLGEHGLLGVGATEPNAFDEDDVALVELLALVATGAFDRIERESEMRQLQRIVEHVDEMGFLLDGEDRFVYVTEPFASYVGRDADALVGTRLPELLADPDVGAYESADYRRGLTEGNVTLEVDLRAGGEFRPVEIELSRTAPDGDAVTTAGVVTDITELAATRSDLATERERFRELFENLQDPVVEVEFRDGDPIVQYLNPAFSEVFGYDSDTIRGQNINDYIVPDRERDGALALDDQAMHGDQTSVEVQRETDEGYRDFLLRCIPYPREGGMYAFAVYTDITDQKERQRYLQVMHRVLRHNLRNDINVVLALARQLRENVADSRLAEHAGTLEANAQDIASLSEKAKEIERVIGRRSEETATVDAASHLRESVAAFRESHPDASLELDVPETMWVHAREDLKRVFDELIENAVEHSDDGAPDIRIDTEPGDSDLVRLCFHDDGPGIPESEWGVVTGEANITQLNHGSGLGLWLVRWLVESFGGELSREAEGDGTKIVVSLRRGRPNVQGNAAAGQATPED